MGEGRTVGKSEAEEDVVDAVVHAETPQGKPLLLLLSERGGGRLDRGRDGVVRGWRGRRRPRGTQTTIVIIIIIIKSPSSIVGPTFAANVT